MQATIPNADDIDLLGRHEPNAALITDAATTRLVFWTLDRGYLQVTMSHDEARWLHYELTKQLHGTAIPFISDEIDGDDQF